MKSRLSIFATVFLTLIILNAGLYLSLRVYVSDLMLALEKDQADLSMQRLVNALDRETIALDELNNDWAAWDDTYEFIADQNAHYLKSNLVDSTFTSSRLDLIVMVDTTGNPVYRQAYDREEEEFLEAPASFFTALVEKPGLWKFSEPGQYTRGFLNLPEGVLQLSSRPIVTSNGEGPVRGTLFMGRFFSELEHERMEELTEQKFSIQNIFASEAIGSELKESLIQVRLTDKDQLLATTTLPDLLGQPLWQISSEFPRSFFQRGLQSLTTFMSWNFLFTGLLALIVVIISDRLSHARLNLLESRQRYRELSLELQTILDGINSPIILVSMDLEVIWANNSGAILYGLTDNLNAGKLDINLPFESFTDDQHCPVKKTLSSGQPQEEVVPLKDGRIFKMTAFPLADPGSVTTGAICLMADISEQVQLQEEAEQRNRLTSLGEMAAGLAHDINNPVSMLIVNLPMVRDVCRDMKAVLETRSPAEIPATFGGLSYSFIREKMPYLLGEMINNTGKIKTLSDDMKAFSQQHVVAGPAEIFGVNSVVDSAVRLANYSLHKATQKFTVALADNLPEVSGYPHQIEQVVINLLLNASQALESTDQAISIRTLHDQPSDQVFIEVDDEGRGISSENLSQVTKPFFTTRRGSGGTGLGLSLASRIMHEHGGNLEINSTMGKGTQVRIILPRKQDAQ